MTLKLGFFASKGGSSMKAIVQAIEAGTLDARALLVISNNKDAPALDFARERGLSWLCIPTKADPDAADHAAAQALRDAGVELVVLSGYLRKLGPAVLKAYAGRILNIHPALLPKFGGHGLYGRKVHEAVAAAGEAVSGATIHIVDGDYDTGPIVAQIEVALAPDDDAEAVERRVTAAEPAFFVETLRRIAGGSLKLPHRNRSVISDNIP